jgi:Zn-dependent protease
MYPLAVVDFSSPLFWAVAIGWILSVTLHEFAHGIVGYLGGDYTIKERGGLTLNPLQYVDPVNSILFPAIALVLGGVPLPGGVTYIRRDLLRSRAWSSAVAIAGPTMNFLIFLLCALPFHPKFGWIHPTWNQRGVTMAQEFLGATAKLQLLSVFLNLIPIPPLDGFQTIAPLTMSEETERQMIRPPASSIGFLVYFMVLWNVPQVIHQLYRMGNQLLVWLGFDYSSRELMRRAFNQALFGHSD